MAVGNFVFFLLTALVAANLIFAESEQPPPPGDQPAVDQEGPDQEPNGRFFFNTRCNYTATPGSICLNCNTALRCLSNNLGTVRICRGFLPYCNSGICSFFPSGNCSLLG